jgi:hypothetical protein
MAEVKTGPNTYKNYFKIHDSLKVNISLFAADFYTSNYPSLVSIVQNDKTNYLIVLDDDIAITTEILNTDEKLSRKFKRGFFGATSIKGLINFTANTENDNYIYKLVYNETENKYRLRNFIEADNLSDYFFARLDQKNYYLVYSNKTEGFLSIRLLKK